MRIIQVFESFDGTRHNSEAECRAHERRLAHARLVGLTIEQIEAAMSGADAELADAIEVVGAKIARERRERGEMKRERAPRETSAHGDQPTRQLLGQAGSPVLGQLLSPEEAAAEDEAA